MSDSYNRLGLFSGSTLKIIACIFMTIDHVGLTFFPSNDIFRIIGRLAFPMFAFFIAEGSRYSNNKLRRFFTVFTVGALFFVFYCFYDGSVYGNIFLTFSVSILVDQVLYMCKKQILKGSIIKLIIMTAGFFALILILYLVYDLIHFEYGFFGMLLPAIINLFSFKDIEVGEALGKLDDHWTRIILLALGLVPLSITGNLGVIQFYCFFAVVPLALYNGKIGCKKLKYAFYIFYPAHLVIIEAIAMLISFFSK